MPTNDKWLGMNWIRQEKRLAIYLRDGFCCAYCGTDLRQAKPGGIALDHLVCRCNGGSNDATNLVTACTSCNSGRGAKSWRKFATPGAIERINKLRRRALNVPLAKAILAGTAHDPRSEAAR